MQAIRENILRGTADFSMTIYYHKVDRVSVAYHFHTELEIIFVKEGEFNLTLNGEVFRARAGDIFFANINDLHAMDNNLGYTEFCSLVFDPRLLNFAPTSPFYKQILGPIQSGKAVFPRKVEKGDPCYEGIWKQLWRIIECEGSEFAKSEQIAAFCEIFLTLFKNDRLLLSSEHGGERVGAETVKNVMNYVTEHLSEHIGLCELSNVAQMSEKYFCAFFKKQTGLTPIQYVNRVRIERACELLKLKKMNVTEVSLECGFESLSYFIRRFKAQMGTPPSAYKRQNAKII